MDISSNKEPSGTTEPQGKSPLSVYERADLNIKKNLFRKYLEENNLTESTIQKYIHPHMKDGSVLKVIHDDTIKQYLYDVTDVAVIDKIYRDVCKLQINTDRNRIYSASVKKYGEFIDFLNTEQARDFIKKYASETTIELDFPDANTDTDTEYSHHVPFSVARIIELISDTGLQYSPLLIKRFTFSLLSKSFLILSGLAGSGKTQLAIVFAKALIDDRSQMCVVSVGADWTNREPLLGFPNALAENTYVKPENGVLDLLIEASRPENCNRPYFLILDEMNMSYVERYFADFLSSMESHEPISLWKGAPEEDSVPQSIALPGNLFIIGTINVDETTYMFSPKVLDRANVIEFKISPEEMDAFLNSMRPVSTDAIDSMASDMGASFVAIAQKKELANDTEIKSVLSRFFRDLKPIGAEFGYRSATEIYRYIRIAKDNDDTQDMMTDDDIIDSAIVQKLMPKIHGSRNKLSNVLNTLWKECFRDDSSKEINTISADNVDQAIYRLTADKIRRMHDAAYDNGFTSFAEA